MTSIPTFALLAVLVAVANASSLSPPPVTKPALMARYIVNQADYTSIGSISTRANTKGYPYVSLVSLSDSATKGQGSGVPYIFVTPWDAIGQDLKQDSRVTMMMSLVQGSFCDEKGYDPMDPRCARAIMSGTIKEITAEDPEYSLAKNAMFGRHSWLAHMPPNHHFYLAKLEIQTIEVFAKFGGVAHVTAEEYYKADKEDVDEYARQYR